MSATTTTTTADTGRVYAAQVAKMLDHSMLRPEMTRTDVEAGVRVAGRFGVASVCVRPCDVALAAAILAGTDVAVGTVIGFPHGNVTTGSKVEESRSAMASGAVELDMVINIGWVKSGLWAEVQADIAAVVAVAHAGGALVKVILENAYLTEEEKVKACQVAEAAGVDFVKTSTGFAATGSHPADLRLMRATVSSKVQVKAAGGIRNLDTVLTARACGATRCGATATAAIMDEFAQRDPKGEGIPFNAADIVASIPIGHPTGAGTPATGAAPGSTY